jgi:hypothetical protein
MFRRQLVPSRAKEEVRHRLVGPVQRARNVVQQLRLARVEEPVAWPREVQQRPR